MKAQTYQDLAAEKDVLKTCLDYLEVADIVHVRFNNVRVRSSKVADKWVHNFVEIPENQKGAPDIFVFLPILLNLWDIPNKRAVVRHVMIALAVECKRPKVKKLREQQRRWRDRWEKRGGVYVEVRQLEDLTAAIGGFT